MTSTPSPQGRPPEPPPQDLPEEKELPLFIVAVKAPVADGLLVGGHLPAGGEAETPQKRLNSRRMVNVRMFVGAGKTGVMRLPGSGNFTSMSRQIPSLISTSNMRS